MGSKSGVLQFETQMFQIKALAVFFGDARNRRSATFLPYLWRCWKIPDYVGRISCSLYISLFISQLVVVGSDCSRVN